MSKKQSFHQESQEKNQPINTLRLGRVKSTIWSNKTEKGTFFSGRVSLFHVLGSDFRIYCSMFIVRVSGSV